MLLTIFPAIVFCAAISLTMLSAVAFIQEKSTFHPHQRRHGTLFFREKMNYSTVWEL